MDSSSVAITLSIFFVRSTEDEANASEVLLALPTETRSTITAQDMWSSLTTLGVDIKHLEALASGCTENITVAYDCTSLGETAKVKRLLDIGSEQLVAVRERHSQLEALNGLVEALQAQKRELECDKMRIAGEITRLQTQDSLWGWEDPDEVQRTLFPFPDDEDAGTEHGNADSS